MSRRNFTEGVEVKYTDLNSITYNLERQLYDRILRQIVSNDVTGFWKNGFFVTRVDADTIAVAPGIGYEIDVTQVSPQAQGRPIVNLASFNLDTTAADGSNPRIDLVVTKTAFIDEISETRRFKSTDDAVVASESRVVQRDWSNATIIVAGTPAGSPVAPAVPAGYTKIATLAITATTGIAVSGAVTDNRTILTIIGDGGTETPDPGNYPVTLDSSKDQYTYFVNSAAARTITLPTPAAGFEVTFIDKDGLMDLNALTVESPGSESINGSAFDFLCEVPYGTWTFYSDGNNYFVK